MFWPHDAPGPPFPHREGPRVTLRYANVASTLDLTAPGKRAGHFSLTHSDDRHGFAAIRAPLGVIRGGSGPVALICGGNHGDEYEGQIIARRLFGMLEPADVPGGLILAPALNMPAVKAARRVSPLDRGNLNRSFPGSADGGPTKAIAGFITTQLMPLADLALDLHSGGSNVDFLDCAYFCQSGDPLRDRRTRALAEMMALPFTVVVPPHDTAGDFDGAAHGAGCAMLSCELGGEGKISQRALNAGWQGVVRILADERIISEAAATRLGKTDPQPTRFLDLGENQAFVTADHHGLAEPLVRIGDSVAKGQAIALLRDLDDMNRDAVRITAPCDGIVVIRRRTVLVEPGDHLFLIAAEIDESALPR
jgi:predicted deacylase